MIKYLLTGFALCCTLVLSAQTSIGTRAGVFFANVRTTDLLDNVSDEFNDLTAYSVALTAKVPLSTTLSFQPELAFTQKGFSTLQQTDVTLFDVPLPVGVEVDTRFGYLETPLLLRADFGNQEISGYVVGGPSLGYAVDGQLQTRTAGLIEFDVLDQDIDLDAIGYNRFEFSGVIGAGVSYDAGFGDIFVEGRYQHGFTELYDIPVLSETVKNRGIGINAGISIPVNKR